MTWLRVKDGVHRQYRLNVSLLGGIASFLQITFLLYICNWSATVLQFRDKTTLHDSLTSFDANDEVASKLPHHKLICSLCNAFFTSVEHLATRDISRFCFSKAFWKEWKVCMSRLTHWLWFQIAPVFKSYIDLDSIRLNSASIQRMCSRRKLKMLWLSLISKYYFSGRYFTTGEALSKTKECKAQINMTTWQLFKCEGPEKRRNLKQQQVQNTRNCWEILHYGHVKFKLRVRSLSALWLAGRSQVPTDLWHRHCAQWNSISSCHRWEQIVFSLDMYVTATLPCWHFRNSKHWALCENKNCEWLRVSACCSMTKLSLPKALTFCTNSLTSSSSGVLVKMSRNSKKKRSSIYQKAYEPSNFVFTTHGFLCALLTVRWPAPLHLQPRHRRRHQSPGGELVT